jgi:hypothetical protein
MNTNTSRGLIGFVAAPVTAAAVMAGAVGFASVAHAGVTPGVNVHASRMMLSRESLAQQKQVHGKSAAALDQQRQQEEKQSDSPAKQEASELNGDLKAEQVKQTALKTVESLANVQPAEPKAHTYALKTPIHKPVSLMRAGFSQMAG